MKRLLTPIFFLSILAFGGCSSDNGGTNPPPPNAPPRPVAVVKVTAPSMNDANDPIWNDVDSAEVDLARSGAAKLPAVVTDKVDVQAIINGTKLYLRFQWDDGTLNIMKDAWELNDTVNLNFTKLTYMQEDQLYLLFAGLPGDTMDAIVWRALTTGAANLAEGYEWIDGVLDIDSGAQVVAFSNTKFGDDTRPKYVHKDGHNFTGSILYTDDTVATSTFFGDKTWPKGFLVPGWYIDSTVTGRVLGNYKQSRWDTQAISSYDQETHRYSLVLSRELNTTYPDDLNLDPLDSVQIKLIVIDNFDSVGPYNGSNQASSDLFWLILKAESP